MHTMYITYNTLNHTVYDIYVCILYTRAMFTCITVTMLSHVHHETNRKSKISTMECWNGTLEWNAGIELGYFINTWISDQDSW